MKWVGSNTDIDDRKRFEETQLRSQKLESLGTLAGGIAHDFNNMLLVIQGNAQLAQEMISGGQPRAGTSRSRSHTPVTGRRIWSGASCRSAGRRKRDTRLFHWARSSTKR